MNDAVSTSSRVVSLMRGLKRGSTFTAAEITAVMDGVKHGAVAGVLSRMCHFGMLKADKTIVNEQSHRRVLVFELVDPGADVPYSTRRGVGSRQGRRFLGRDHTYVGDLPLAENHVAIKLLKAEAARVQPVAQAFPTVADGYSDGKPPVSVTRRAKPGHPPVVLTPPSVERMTHDMVVSLVSQALSSFPDSALIRELARRYSRGQLHWGYPDASINLRVVEADGAETETIVRGKA